MDRPFMYLRLPNNTNTRFLDIYIDYTAGGKYICATSQELETLVQASAPPCPLPYFIKDLVNRGEYLHGYISLDRSNLAKAVALLNGEEGLC